MHLLGPHFTTTKTNHKQKQPLKINKILIDELSVYNKHNKKLRLPPLTLEQFVEYKRGMRDKIKNAVRDPLEASSLQRKTQFIPTVGDQIGDVRPVKKHAYTGSYIKGIGTMHKSNLVPITSNEQAEDIARMRR